MNAIELSFCYHQKRRNNNTTDNSNQSPHVVRGHYLSHRVPPT